MWKPETAALPHVPFRKGASIESERFARCDTSVNSQKMNCLYSPGPKG